MANHMRTRGEPIKPEETFTVTEAVAKANITARQLDYWTREGWVRPVGEQAPGSGTYRRYEAREVLKAAILGRASRAGIRLKVLTESDQGLSAGLEDIIIELKALHEAARVNYL